MRQALVGKVGFSAFAIVVASAGLARIGIAPASAATGSQTFTVVCAAPPIGTQTQVITLEATLPDQVVEGSTFTVSFPGGDTELPSTALGGAVKIQGYKDLSTTFQIQTASFVSGTGSADGPTTVNGSPVTATGTVQPPDKFTIAEPGPFPPGTLHTPTWSVSATVPDGTAGGTVSVNGFRVTTTAMVGSSPPGAPVAVTCEIPNTPLIEVPIVGGGPNTPPAVDAGPDRTGDISAAIALDGSVTDPDSAPSVHWSIDGASCTFANAASPATSVTCGAPGTYTATLTADDGRNPPVSDSAQVTVVQEDPIFVSAGPDISFAVGHASTLQGTVSAEGQAPTVSWTINTPSCAIANPSAPSTAILCLATGTFTATLAANDGVHPPIVDTATVTVRPDVPPVVDAGPDVQGNTAEPIALNGTVTDPDAPPSALWTVNSPNCTLANAHAVDTTITCAPHGVYTATLNGDDGVNPVVHDTTTVTVNDVLFPFDWDVDATTHIKKLNQDVVVPTGKFVGVVNLTTGDLSGSITLPPAEVTLGLPGFGLVTANMQITETQPITGHLEVGTFQVTATAVFDIKVLSVHPTLTPSVNLVGDSCKTSTPVSVTMSGTANLTGSSTFSGTYTIPPLANCGLATTALNLVIPGPDNTFSATVAPPPEPPTTTTTTTTTTAPPTTTTTTTATTTSTTTTTVPPTTTTTTTTTTVPPTTTTTTVPPTTTTTVPPTTTTTVPPLVPIVNIGSMALREGDERTKPAKLVVTLSRPPTQPVSVTYGSHVGTAGTADYKAKQGTLSFSTGQISKTIAINIVGDTTAEPDEGFSVVLLGATNATIGDQLGEVAILNDDGPPASGIEASVSDSSVYESGGRTMLVFTVSLNRRPSAAVTLRYNTQPGTAGGTDFKAKSGTLSFSTTQLTKPVSIVVTGDASGEPDELMQLVLSAPTGPLSIVDATGTGEIRNDD